ncbi:MAG: DUF6429 family protein [Chitinophagaceae bacterium]
MEQEKMDKLAKDLVLTLINMYAWKEKVSPGPVLHRSWKGYDFGILDQLQEEGLIGFSNRAKSVYISEEGIRKAEELLLKFAAIDDKTPDLK